MEDNVEGDVEGDVEDNEYMEDDDIGPPIPLPGFAHNPLSVYALNYNILRIMSGMGGLRYDDPDPIPIPDAPCRPYGNWTRENNFIFLKTTRQEIWQWLLIGRLELHCSKDIVYLICGWIATESNCIQ